MRNRQSNYRLFYIILPKNKYVENITINTGPEFYGPLKFWTDACPKFNLLCPRMPYDPYRYFMIILMKKKKKSLSLLLFPLYVARISL